MGWLFFYHQGMYDKMIAKYRPQSNNSSRSSKRQVFTVKSRWVVSTFFFFYLFDFFMYSDSKF